MYLLKLFKNPFYFGGACPTQLFAVSTDFRFVYGRVRGGKFSLHISSEALSKQCQDLILNTDKKIYRDDDLFHDIQEKDTNIQLIQIDISDTYPDIGGLCYWNEFVSICHENKVDITFYTVVDYMKSQKKGNN